MVKVRDGRIAEVESKIADLPNDTLEFPDGVLLAGLIDFQATPAIRAARERGILFDLGHGSASFSCEVAEVAIGDRFLPTQSRSICIRVIWNRDIATICRWTCRD